MERGFSYRNEVWPGRRGADEGAFIDVDGVFATVAMIYISS